MEISMDELMEEWTTQNLYQDTITGNLTYTLPSSNTWYDISNGNDSTAAVTIQSDGSDVQANSVNYWQYYEFDTTYNYYPESIMSELASVQPMPSDIFQWNVIFKKAYKKKLDLRLPDELFEL